MLSISAFSLQQLRLKRLAEMHVRMAHQLEEKQARDVAEASEKEQKVDLRNSVVKPRIEAWTAGKKASITHFSDAQNLRKSSARVSLMTRPCLRQTILLPRNLPEWVVSLQPDASALQARAMPVPPSSGERFTWPPFPVVPVDQCF